MSIRDRRVLALVTDAYGGVGGIATYNRDVFQALSDHPRIAETVVIPRVRTFATGGQPDRVVQRDEAMKSTRAYLWAVVRQLRSGRIDLIHCAHANLAPVAVAAAAVARVPWSMSLYGLEVWSRRTDRLLAASIERANLYLPISDVTEERFRLAYPGARAPSTPMPNALHREQFAPGPKPPRLLGRYGLTNEEIIMTMGRVGEDYWLKGFERVIRLMPRLLVAKPDLRYLICGDGPKRDRLERVADELGVSRAVIFTGYVDEAEKADHYRLADAYVMPSKAEGFGFVFTEAMACGIPVVASSLDGGVAAVLNGKIGRIADPDDQDGLVEAILGALATAKHVPPEIERFDYPHFRDRLHAAVDGLIAR